MEILSLFNHVVPNPLAFYFLCGIQQLNFGEKFGTVFNKLRLKAVKLRKDRIKNILSPFVLCGKIQKTTFSFSYELHVKINRNSTVLINNIARGNYSDRFYRRRRKSFSHVIQSFSRIRCTKIKICFVIAWKQHLISQHMARPV